MNQDVVAEQTEALAPDSQWPLWEVFTQSEQGAPHEHAGSLHAADAEQALQNARDVYARRRPHAAIPRARAARPARSA